MSERFGFNYRRLTADKNVKKDFLSYIRLDTKVVFLSVEKEGEIGEMNGGRGGEWFDTYKGWADYSWGKLNQWGFKLKLRKCVYVLVVV